MGRNKLKIQKLETSSGRQVTYSKRKTGITKKLRELSILCDCDALLLLFSTTGKPTLCLGENSKLEGVIKRYAEVSPQERRKKKLECLEALKKTFRDTDHTVEIEQLMNQSPTKPAEDLKKQIKIYQDQIAETLTFLGPLGNLDDIDNIESIDKIVALEKSLNDLLVETKMQKDYVETMHANNVQFPPQCTNQGTGLPLQISNIIPFQHGENGLSGPEQTAEMDFELSFDFEPLDFDSWEPLLPQQSFPLHQGDLTSTSNQGSTNNNYQTAEKNGENGLSVTEQTAELDFELSFDFEPLDFDSWEPLLPQQSFPLHQGDLTSTSNQGSTNNSYQTTEKNGENGLSTEQTVDDFLIHSPLIFEPLDFDSWEQF